MSLPDTLINAAKAAHVWIPIHSEAMDMSEERAVQEKNKSKLQWAYSDKGDDCVERGEGPDKTEQTKALQLVQRVETEFRRGQGVAARLS